MLQQQDQNQIQTRRNKMKAIDFHEQLQMKMVKQIFTQLKSNWKQKVQRYRSHYNKNLYLKSFKAIIEYCLLQDDQKFQVQKQPGHEQFINAAFQSEKQFVSESKLLRNYILKGRLKKFREQVNTILTAKQKKRKKAIQLLQKEKQEQEQYKKRQQEQDRKARTQEAFYRRALISEKQPDKYMTSFAENSRKQYSPMAITSRQNNKSRRKFVPIKVLPPKPALNPQIYQNGQTNTSNNFKQINSKATESMKIPEKKQEIIYPQKSEYSYQLSHKKEESPKKIKDQKEQQEKLQISRMNNDKIKQNILSILSELKMIEILSINEIVDDYSQIFKRQSFPNEKNYVKQSLKLLDRIRLIE